MQRFQVVDDDSDDDDIEDKDEQQREQEQDPQACDVVYWHLCAELCADDRLCCHCCVQDQYDDEYQIENVPEEELPKGLSPYQEWMAKQQLKVAQQLDFIGQLLQRSPSGRMPAMWPGRPDLSSPSWRPCQQLLLAPLRRGS